ncbi:ATP-binding response regulator [Paremcibacter congregatus]|uniref:ATP-binding response regulator n=1 Tax=Paremcibacter congregatus TaxID=2043170 RepID=UPI0030EED08F
MTVQTGPMTADIPLEKKILSERLALIAQQIKIILVIVLIISTLTAYTLWSTVPHDMLINWLFLVNFPSLLRIILLFSQKHHTYDLDLLAFFNVFLAAWSGTAWGAVGFFFPLYADPTVMQFLTVVLFGITAGSVPGLSSFVPCYFAFSIPVMGGLAFRHFSYGDEIHISASIFCLIFLLINMAFSLVIQNSMIQSIRLRLEKNELIGKLRQEKDKAISARDAKSSFLAAASHDLRQPLHAMGFFIETLKKEITDEDQSLLLQKVERTSDNLRAQLNDLLDISKIDAGILTPHPTPLSVETIFSALKSEFTPLAQEKNIDLHIVARDLIINSDAHMIERILNNLVSNALRYTKPGGRILVGCRRRGKNIRFEVHDTGIGIPGHLIGHIFAEYYQIANPERDRNKGLGLGLSIVKGMCDLLDHPIEVRSEINKGTSFYVSTPRSHKRPSIPDSLSQHFNLKLETGNIILIDDERDALDAMSTLLENWGHTVVPFEAETEALQYLSHHDFCPDMIITDFRLREMRTGAEAISAINKKLKKSVPAVIITGDTAKDRMLQARKSGHVLLHKPILPAKLRTVINNTLIKAY